MAKIIGRIPVAVLRERTRRAERPLTISLGSAIRAAAQKKQAPVPQEQNVADKKV